MKLLTEVSEKDFTLIRSVNNSNLLLLAESRVVLAVKNGIPLPEHHGALKDASEIIELLVSRKYDKKAGSDDLVKGYNLGIDAAIRLIRHVDAVIPATEPPHWIERRLKMGLHDWTCSICKCQCEETVKICPNCGTNTEGRYEMAQDDGGYWFNQTATKEGDGE